jgi:hypothetical protein
MQRLAVRIGDAIRFLFAGVTTGTYRAVAIVVSVVAWVPLWGWIPYLREERRPAPRQRKDDRMTGRR